MAEQLLQVEEQIIPNNFITLLQDVNTAYVRRLDQENIINLSRELLVGINEHIKANFQNFYPYDSKDGIFKDETIEKIIDSLASIAKSAAITKPEQFQDPLLNRIIAENNSELSGGKTLDKHKQNIVSAIIKTQQDIYVDTKLKIAEALTNLAEKVAVYGSLTENEIKKTINLESVLKNTTTPFTESDHKDFGHIIAQKFEQAYSKQGEASYSPGV